MHYMKFSSILPDPIHTAFTCAVAATALLSLSACDVKKTEDGKAPKVEVDPGKLPKYEVETPKVTTTTEQKEVTVPKVTTEQKVITVPKVQVTMPGQPTPTPAPSISPAP